LVKPASLPGSHFIKYWLKPPANIDQGLEIKRLPVCPKPIAWFWPRGPRPGKASMTIRDSRPMSEPEPEAPAFDDLHLRHYTMQDPMLAVEVLNLFLTQLPSTLDLIRTAKTKADITFAAHALKGAAASIGARKLYSLAVDLDRMDFPGDAEVRALRLKALQAAAAEFRDAARAVFPAVSRQAI
jgi:hypothetical protein